MKFDINKILNGFINWVKNNKKIAIIGGVVIVMALAMIVLSNGSGNATGALKMIDTLHKESYVADGDINISEKKLKININKLDEDIDISLKNDDMDFSDLYVKSGASIYFNSECIKSKSGLLNLNLNTEAKDSVSLYDVIFEAISNSDGIEYITSDESQKMTVNTTENWATFWNDIYNAIDENKDAIAAGYSTPDDVQPELQNILTDIRKMADTETIANTIEIAVIPGENQYVISFDLTIDNSIAPDFIKTDYIDSNKLKVSGSITFTLSDGAEIKKPSGAIHAANANGIKGVFTDLWNTMFEKKEYVSFAQISVTNDTVSATYNLGETTENCQLVFSKDGVTNAVWYITSADATIIDAYVDKYKSEDTKEDNFLKFEKEDGTCGLTITVSENGITSFNKIAKNPKDMGAYLGSVKGGDIIV